MILESYTRRDIQRTSGEKLFFFCLLFIGWVGSLVFFDDLLIFYFFFLFGPHFFFFIFDLRMSGTGSG